MILIFLSAILGPLFCLILAWHATKFLFLRRKFSVLPTLLFVLTFNFVFTFQLMYESPELWIFHVFDSLVVVYLLVEMKYWCSIKQV